MTEYWYILEDNNWRSENVKQRSLTAAESKHSWALLYWFKPLGVQAVHSPPCWGSVTSWKISRKKKKLRKPYSQILVTSPAWQRAGAGSPGSSLLSATGLTGPDCQHFHRPTRASQGVKQAIKKVCRRDLWEAVCRAAHAESWEATRGTRWLRQRHAGKGQLVTAGGQEGGRQGLLCLGAHPLLPGHR